MATGDNYASIAIWFGIGMSTVSMIVRRVALAIWDQMAQRYMAIPSTPQKWTHLAEDFERLWNFPNCVGALDGKHVRVTLISRDFSLV